jgi:hypothetical protein
MLVGGERVIAPRMLLLNEINFGPGRLVFALEQPLFLDTGDQLWAEDDAIVVERVSGRRERPIGDMTTARRCWQPR